MENILFDAQLVATILVVTQVIKKLLESPILSWILKLLHHEELGTVFAWIVSALVAIIAGFTQYGADGITWSEMLEIILALFQANGLFLIVKKASGGEK